MSTLFDMAFELLLWLQQEFRAAFQEVARNVVLLKNLRQELNFGTQKTAHENFAKFLSIKKVIYRTGYLPLADVSVICKSLLKHLKAELILSRNTFQWELVPYGNQSIDLYCKLFE